METKRTKVTMLPTEDYTGIVLHGTGLDSYHKTKSERIFAIEQIGGNPQHLYFINDEEIKKGNWVVSYAGGNNTPNFIEQVKKIKDGYLFHKNSKGNNRVYNYKKIIATTDSSLTISDKYTTFDILPQPSEAFIQKYCELGGIDEVEVEYEANVLVSKFCNNINCNSGVIETTNKLCKKCNPNSINYKLKVDPIHNTITIHSIKNTYTREEVEELLFKYASEEWGVDTSKQDVDQFNEWIKDNL